MATIQIYTNQGEPGTWHKPDSTENPLLLRRIVDLGDKDEQLNFIQCTGNGIFMNTDANRSGHL